MQEKSSPPKNILQTGSKILDFATKKILSFGSIFDTKYGIPQNRKERVQRTKKVGYIAVLRSGAIGAIASAIPILILYQVILVQYPHLNTETNSVTGWDYAFLIGLIIAVSLLATILELLLLYYDAVRAAGKMNQITQRDVDAESEVDEAIQQTLPLGLTKAALGMNKDTSPKFGIDPLENSSKAAIAAKGAAYRAQVLLFNALVKRILRRILARMFGRTAPRVFVEWLLLPIYVIWNMVGTTVVMNELICRANGQEATKGVLDKIQLDKNMSPQMIVLIKNSIQHHVHGAKAIHPNIEFIILFLHFKNCEFTSPEPSHDTLNSIEKVQLAKLILVLPLLETRRTKLNRDAKKFVDSVLTTQEKKTWLRDATRYIKKGIDFNEN